MQRTKANKLNPLTRKQSSIYWLIFNTDNPYVSGHSSSSGSPSVVREARIENGKLFYEKRWFRRGQTVHVEQENIWSFHMQSQQIGMFCQAILSSVWLLWTFNSAAESSYPTKENMTFTVYRTKIFVTQLCPPWFRKEHL